MTRLAESRVGGNERPGNGSPRWIAVLDRIRLTGLLRKTPAPAGVFYSADGSVPDAQLLQRPAVAVRVLEEHELAPGEVLHVARLDAPLDQLGTRSRDVGDDDLRPGRAER